MRKHPPRSSQRRAAKLGACCSASNSTDKDNHTLSIKKEKKTRPSGYIDVAATYSHCYFNTCATLPRNSLLSLRLIHREESGRQAELA